MLIGYLFNVCLCCDVNVIIGPFIVMQLLVVVLKYNYRIEMHKFEKEEFEKLIKAKKEIQQEVVLLSSFAN